MLSDINDYDNHSNFQKKVINNDINSIKEYLEHGMNPRFQSSRALSLASNYGHLDIVNLLLDHGSDPSDNMNCSIIWALEKNHLNIVKRLLKWYLINNVKLPTLPKLNKIKREITYEILLIYELRIPEDLCRLIKNFT